MTQREQIERRRSTMAEINALPSGERLLAAKRLSDGAQERLAALWGEMDADLRERIAIANADAQEYGQFYDRLYNQRIRDMMFTPKDIGIGRREV